MAKVVCSRNPDLKKDDLVWGITGWEEYSFLTETKSLFKIEHKDVPLSYYTGILGKQVSVQIMFSLKSISVSAKIISQNIDLYFHLLGN